MQSASQIAINKVTAPTIFLPSEGPSVLLYGATNDWKDEILGFFHDSWASWGDTDINVFVEENAAADFEWVMSVANFTQFTIVAIDGSIDAHEAFVIRHLIEQQTAIVILAPDAPEWAQQLINLIDVDYVYNVDGAIALLFQLYTGTSIEEFAETNQAG